MSELSEERKEALREQARRAREVKAEYKAMRERGETPPVDFGRPRTRPGTDTRGEEVPPETDNVRELRPPTLDAAKPRRTPDLNKIRNGLYSMFVMSGVGVSMFDTFDGRVIADNADKLADAWTDLAAQDAKVRKVLLTFVSGGAWGGAIATSMFVALPIFAHHRMVPPETVQMAANAGIKVPPRAPAGNAPPTSGDGAGVVGETYQPPMDGAYETSYPFPGSSAPTG